MIVPLPDWTPDDWLDYRIRCAARGLCVVLHGDGVVLLPMEAGW